MGLVLSTSSAYKFVRRQRLAMNRGMASSKVASCLWMKPSALRKSVEIALECDQERRMRLAGRLESLRQDHASELRDFNTFLVRSRNMFASMKTNPDMLNTIGRNPQFVEFKRQIKTRRDILRDRSEKVRRQELAVRSMDDSIRRWKDTLVQMETEEDDFDTTEIMNLTANYLENRPIENTADARRDASDRLGDALSGSLPFDITDEEGPAVAGSEADKENAELVRLLFGKGNPTQQQSYGVMDDISLEPQQRDMGGDMEMITFNAERVSATGNSRAGLGGSSGRGNTPAKPRNMFDGDS